MTYSREECISALREARERLGHSPGYAEYKNTDIYPSVSAIEKKFGGFNKAKREAGLQTKSRGQKPKSVNTSYFQEVSDKETAYWLGFITGDGGVYQTSYSDRFVMELHQKDEPHLKKFREAISSEHKITSCNGGVQISVHSDEFVSGLRQHGVDYDKTFSGSLPDLDSDELRAAFTRGLSDADGTFSLDYNWRIAGANRKRFAGLQEWIPVESVIKQEENCLVLTVTGKHDKKPELVSWLYPAQEATEPALSRKKKQARPFW